MSRLGGCGHGNDLMVVLSGEVVGIVVDVMEKG